MNNEALKELLRHSFWGNFDSGVISILYPFIFGLELKICWQYL